jgi:uncharacterized membrane protein
MHGGDGNSFWWEAPRHAHDAWWHGPLTFIVILLVVALLIAGVVWLVRRLSVGTTATGVAAGGSAAIAAAGVDPAVAALRMRYARGEVTRDDYLDAMADLIGAPGEAPTPAPEPESTGDDTAPTAT